MSVVKIEQRLIHRIGVREWGLPSLVMPGQIWRSEEHSTISCMVASEDPNKVRIETLPLEVIDVGELSVLPMHWRRALWEYCKAYPSSGCGYGPFLAISEQERNTFLRSLGNRLVGSDEIGCSAIAHDIGQFAAREYELVES